MMKNFIVCLIFICLSSQLHSAPLERIEVAPNVYALVGPMEQRSTANLGNNATFGFIVQREGVVLIDSGGTLLGAKQIAAEVTKVTDKPVILVINSGGQDHRWFGNSYFASRGAEVITSQLTYDDQLARKDSQIDRISNYVADAWVGTDPQPANKQFSGTYRIEGDTPLELIEMGPTHTGGETGVWLPVEKVLFTGDSVYLDRMLGVGPQSQHKPWIDAFEKIRSLTPDKIVPGHGYPANMKKAEAETLNYLLFLRSEISKLIENGGSMQEVDQIDQSAFSHLKAYDELHVRNALRVFEEMEWE